MAGPDLKEALADLDDINVIELGGIAGGEVAGRRVLKALMLSSSDKKNLGESAQIQTTDTAFTGLDIIEPPFNPALWALTPEQNTRLMRSVNTWARNTVGLGWRIVPKDPEGNIVEPEDLKGGDKARFKKERETLQKLLMFPNPRMPFTRLMYLVKVDEESTGNGYLEVVRDARGVISSLYHMPAHSVRIRNKDKGFVQIPGLAATDQASSFTVSEFGRGEESRRYFKHFGDPTVVDRRNGKTAGSRLGVRNRATEVLHFKHYSARSSVYGVPRYISTAPSVAGNRLAAERNVTFFDNDAVPRGILMVTGGHLDPASVKRVQQFIKARSQGVENSHRMLVLQLEQKRTALGQGSEGAMHFQPLTVGVTEDASFLAYRAANDEEVREAFGLSESFFRMDLVNRASAEIGRATTNEQEFEPDRVEKEFYLNHTVVTDDNWKGGPNSLATIEFRRPQISDPVEKARMNSVYAASGGLTPNDLREELGKEAFPEEMAWANMPMGWALALLQAGMIDAKGEEIDLEEQAAEQGRAAAAQAEAAGVPQPGAEGAPPPGEAGGGEAEAEGAAGVEAEAAPGAATPTGARQARLGNIAEDHVKHTQELARQVMKDYDEISREGSKGASRGAAYPWKY